MVCGCLAGLFHCEASRVDKKRLTTHVADVYRSNSGAPGVAFNIGHLIGLGDPERALAEHYETGDQIGAGGFGHVYKVRHKATSSDRAAKVIVKQDTSDDLVVAELTSLLKLDHPNVSRFYEWFEDDHCVYLLMEMLDGEDLAKYLQDDALHGLFRQLLHAVTYCHGKGVCHRDLKMDNCMVLEDGNEKTLKLIDFGLAAIFAPCVGQSPQMTDKLGTSLYMSPAIILGEAYGPKCDVWAAGIILYMLLTCQHPFCATPPESEEEEKALFHSIVHKKFRTKPLKEQLATQAEVELVGRLLAKDTKIRPSAVEAMEAQVTVETPRPPMRLLALLARVELFSKASDPFERAVLTVIARNTEENELSTLRKAFDQVDKDGDGEISEAEMVNAFAEADFEEDTAAAIFNAIDVAGTGKIEYTQWLGATLRPQLIASEQALEGICTFFNFDKSGKVDKADLERYVGKEAAAKALERSEVDTKQSIDREELRQILQRIANRRQRILEDLPIGAQGLPGTTPNCRVASW